MIYIDYNIPLSACRIYSNLNYYKNSYQRYLQFNSNGLALYTFETNGKLANLDSENKVSKKNFT